MTWCGQCFTSLEAPSGPPPKPLEMTRVYSRWHKGPTSFGPFGRVTATFVVLLFEYWLYRVNVIGLAVTMVTVVPVVLRDVWKRVPVHVRG